MKLSFVNLVATATVTASSSDATYPAANLKTPQRRGLPAKATVATDSWWLVDFGSVKTVGLVELVRTNFTSVRVQGNATDAWGAPSYNQLLTVAQNPFNAQYQHCHLPAGFTFRYLRLFVPTQTPIEAPLGVFRIGGLFAGAVTTAPTGYSVDADHVVVRPFLDKQPDHKAWRERLVMGNRLVRIRLVRGARFTHATPYVAGDEATTWMLSTDLPAWDNDFFALYEDLGNPTMGWVIRGLGDEMPWAVKNPGVVETSWELEEVIGP